MVQERLKGVRQNLIRPVSDEDFVQVDTMALRDCCAQPQSGRLRIEAKSIVQLLRDSG